MNIPLNVTELSAPRPAEKARNRSRISNGQEILPGVDQRLAIARRYRDLLPKLQLIKAAPTAAPRPGCSSFDGSPAALCWPKRSRRGWSRGEPVDIAEHALLSSTLVRLAQRIGINRVVKDLTPSLSEYLTPQEAAE